MTRGACARDSFHPRVLIKVVYEHSRALKPLVYPQPYCLLLAIILDRECYSPL